MLTALCGQTDLRYPYNGRMNLAGGKPRGTPRCPRSLIYLCAMALLASSCGGSTRTSTEPLDAISVTTSTLVDTDAADDDVENTPVTVATNTPPEPGSIASDVIFIDQFGYRPSDPKVAVLVDPQVGFNADVTFTPGEIIEVRRAEDDSVVYSGATEVWADGAVHEQSGDRGWLFDFSEVDEDGTYYVVDASSGEATGYFDIGEDVYDDVLRAALRVFWFNRGNVEHPEELGGPWNDLAAYAGIRQDSEARSVNDKDNADTALDLSGGWFDAGDTNKYVSFASEPVHLLLAAYQSQPQLFTDDFDIPESGNGIPDLIDEVRWEIDWLEKMQLEDGGVITKVGVIDWSARTVPSDNSGFRYYVPPCSSAAISASAMFAHAALVFAEIPELEQDARRIRERAEAAWDWYQESPKRDNCDSGEVKAGDADMSVEAQAATEVVAAIYLGALTGQEEYDAVIRERFDSTSPFLHDSFNSYSPHHGDALLFYASLPTADRATARAIENRIVDLRNTSALYGVDVDADLYRAYMPDGSYHWGSNKVKATIGYSNLAVSNVPDGLERALGHLHYFHGVNPIGTVYLSNMEDLGSERSVERLMHYWFGQGSIYDVDHGSVVGVAPGYIVGGPNRDYSGAAAPPAAQPPQKSYRDWHDSLEPVWEITEPAIYYQASYVRLLTEILGADE